MILSSWHTAPRLGGRRSEKYSPVALACIPPTPSSSDPNISCPLAGLVLCGIGEPASGRPWRGQRSVAPQGGTQGQAGPCGSVPPCQPAVLILRCRQLVLKRINACLLLVASLGSETSVAGFPEAACPYPAAVSEGRTFSSEGEHPPLELQEETQGGHLSWRLRGSLCPGKGGWVVTAGEQEASTQCWLCRPVTLKSVGKPRLTSGPWVLGSWGVVEGVHPGSGLQRGASRDLR